MLKTSVLTVWDRNLQLAFYSMLIYGPWTIYDNPTNPFRGWSLVTVVVAVRGRVGWMGGWAGSVGWIVELNGWR